MLFCQLFLGMGALGSQPRLRQAPAAEYEFDKGKSIYGQFFLPAFDLVIKSVRNAPR